MTKIILLYGESVPYHFTGIVEYRRIDMSTRHITWYEEGYIHREDGPAITYYNTQNVPTCYEYYWHGQFLTPEGHFETALFLAETDEEKNEILFNISNWQNKI